MFMSHATADKAEVEAVGAWLKANDPMLTIWIDRWSMVPGDSLVERINEGISDSDRLVVFLTPESVDSAWVRKEVAAGIVLEAAKKKGFNGENFVIPVLFKALPADYDLPPLLATKLYANFIDADSFDSACGELHRGIAGQPLGPQTADFKNLEVKYEFFDVQPAIHGVRLTFSARLTPEQVGFRIDLGQPYDEDVKQYFGSPRLGGFQMGVFQNREETAYSIAISEPRIKQGSPFVIEFRSEFPFARAPQVALWNP